LYRALVKHVVDSMEQQQHLSSAKLPMFIVGGLLQRAHDFCVAWQSLGGQPAGCVDSCTMRDAACGATAGHTTSRGLHGCGRTHSCQPAYLVMATLMQSSSCSSTLCFLVRCTCLYSGCYLAIHGLVWVPIVQPAEVYSVMGLSVVGVLGGPCPAAVGQL
jgi:hypothetical protein